MKKGHQKEKVILIDFLYNMIIQVIRKMEYKDYLIHVLQFENVFQYLFADKKGNIYQDHIFLAPSFLNKMKYKLNFKKLMFSKEEMELGEKICLNGAVDSIDSLIDIEKKNKKEEKKELEFSSETPKNKDCVWQALEDEGFNVYKCLTHDIAVQMLDDKKPFHEIGILSPIQFKK